MQNTDIFVYASRNKLRFSTIRGELTAEQLWDVPLRSNNGFNLNTIAQEASRELKAEQEENFVDATRKTAEHVRREVALEVVKYVIDAKLSEEEAAKTRAKKRQEKEKLLSILAEKQDGKLSEMSIEDLQKRIAALED